MHYRPVVNQLFSKDPNSVARATDLLLASQGMAIPALLERFPGPIVVDHYGYSTSKLPSAEQHGPLLNVLVQLGDLAAPAICSLFTQPSMEVRFYACLFFKRVHYEPVLPWMLDRLFERETQIRELARLIVRSYRGARGFWDIVRTLRAVLTSGDVWQKEQAILAAATLPAVNTVPQLIEMLNSPNTRLAEVSLQALRMISFEDFANNRRKWSKWWQNQSRGNRNDWLVQALNHNKSHIRELAAEEIRITPGLNIKYNPHAPKAVRQRAQYTVAEFFRNNPRT